MLSKTFIVVLLSCSLKAGGVASGQNATAANERTAQVAAIQFKPLTYGLNFRAYFRVQTFIREQPTYWGDIYESYHSQLATGLIRQTSHDVSDDDEPVSHRADISRKYLYDSQSRRLLELRDGSQGQVDTTFLDDDFFLYENGGSTSYQAEARLAPALAKDSVRLLAENAHLDSQLLLGRTGSTDRDGNLSTADLDLNLNLNLDQFMRPECLEVLRLARLRYITGLARLLHLVECRRGEFKLQQATLGAEHAELTRGQTRLVYRAKRLEASNGESALVGSLDLLVTVHKSPNWSQQTTSGTLAPGAVPLSLVLSYGQTRILVNLFQFEAVGPEEHLSEAASGRSIYLMPLAQPNLSHLLASAQYDSEQERGQGAAKGRVPTQARPRRSFSFEAALTGSHLGPFYADPIELSVAYDARMGALATWTTFVDRTQSDGLLGWSRSVVRQLHDAQSGLKFHLMDSNFGYVGHEEPSYDYYPGDQSNSTSDETKQQWRSCTTDKLSATELTLLEEGADGHLFDLAGATYMGEASVRGIRCQVYERHLFELPMLLGASEHDYVLLGAHLARSKVYLNLYAYGGGPGGGGTGLGDSPRFARLDIRVLSALDASQQRSITLELSAFEWDAAAGVASRDLFTGEHLLSRLAQECLQSAPGARHLDMELWLGADNTQQQHGELQRTRELSLSELAHDRELRDRAVREMLANSQLGFTSIQQVDLVSEMPTTGLDAAATTTTGLLYVKFSLYELWADTVQEELLGYAKSLTVNPRFSLAAGLVAGARSHTYAECRWRAVHSLEPDRRRRNEMNRRDDAHETRDLRLFMFCPARLVCLLGDATWTPMRTQKPLKLDNLLEYPYRAATEAAPQPGEANGKQEEDPTKCVVASVLVRQQVGSARQDQQLVPQGKRQLDWWLVNGGAGLGRSEDSIALQKVRSLNLSLEVTGRGGGNNDERRASSIALKVNKLKLSNRVFASAGGLTPPSSGSDESDANGAHWDQASLLVKPLAGLAYLPASGQASGERATVAAVLSREPLRVASLAECSRACLHSHECKSFSACHEQGQERQQQQLGGFASRHFVSCVLSRLGWSDPVEFHKLARLAQTTTGGNQTTTTGPLILEVTSPTAVDADDDEPAPNYKHQIPMVQVYLQRSRLCNLQARAQMDLYRMAQAHLDYVPSAKYLAPASSPEHCARLCQERGQLMRELAQAKAGDQPVKTRSPAGLGATFRTAACHEFRFAAEGSYCQLLPLEAHWTLLGLDHLLLTPKERAANNLLQQRDTEPSWREVARTKRDSLPTLNRWLGWFGGKSDAAAAAVGEWLAQLRVQSLSEADHFELDFEQIFSAQRDRRLALKAEVATTAAGDAEPALQVQVRLEQYSLYACAKRCLQLRGCRSFDVEMPAARRAAKAASHGQQRANVCQLNAATAADLRANPSAWPSFEMLTAAAVDASVSNSSQQQQPRAEWWHYEPSELALFVIADPGEQPGL